MKKPTLQDGLSRVAVALLSVSTNLGIAVFVAFMVTGSKGVGVGDGSVLLDDLELTSAPLP
jgi:hypothetical protein